MSCSGSEILEILKPLVNDLAEAIGPYCEVVLHDVSQPESSIIAIAGGVTDRRPGGPLTDLVLRMLRSGRTLENSLNYRTHLKDGRVLRSSTLFIRDSNGEVAGCLCINFDLTHWLMTRELVNGFCHTGDPGPASSVTRELFVQDVEDILQDSLQIAIQMAGKPVALMQKEDKLKVVKMLDDAGVFLIKKAAGYTAKELGVSRYTIYNYLDEVRSPIGIGSSDSGNQLEGRQ